MIKSIKDFFKINKYTITKFVIINGLGNRFGDRDKSMGSRALFPEIKLKWIKYFRSLQITIEAMKHVTF